MVATAAERTSGRMGALILWLLPPWARWIERHRA